MVGVRPHKIHVALGEAVKGSALVGEVTSNHWLGDNCHIGFRTRGCFVIAIGDRDVAAAPGSEILVTIPSEAVNIFDVETGVAIQHGLNPAVQLAV